MSPKKLAEAESKLFQRHTDAIGMLVENCNQEKAAYMGEHLKNPLNHSNP